jgi:hypothetical protein
VPFASLASLKFQPAKRTCMQEPTLLCHNDNKATIVCATMTQHILFVGGLIAQGIASKSLVIKPLAFLCVNWHCWCWVEVEKTAL